MKHLLRVDSRGTLVTAAVLVAFLSASIGAAAAPVAQSLDEKIEGEVAEGHTHSSSIWSSLAKVEATSHAEQNREYRNASTCTLQRSSTRLFMLVIHFLISFLIRHTDHDYAVPFAILLQQIKPMHGTGVYFSNSCL